MSYPFIDLDKSKKSDLINHLKEQCGLEKKDSDSKDDLVNAILEFEENNGLLRPAELIPKSIFTTQSEEDSAQTSVALSDNLDDYPKVRIKISTGLGFDGAEDVIVWLNGRSFQMQREKELVVPEPVYQLLMDAKSIVGSQTKEGEIAKTVVQNYNVHFLGNA
ncbi:hypothetical protein [uncultured Aggregatibacter sp.]|uniref:hypothetical protein n=1 Tax=uncultured Aggregatibacter sp. TaxID=470564 RepID=UPI001A483F38|nr:hypothetical protein [uncultured Aggregatibacter sp.]VTX83835.1 Uncharacterised protein [uncultured Aggregatibacter sp.]